MYRYPNSNQDENALVTPLGLQVSIDTSIDTCNPRGRGSDLAPCDFYLFPEVKEIVRGKCFVDDEEAVASREKAVGTTAKVE
ncbi:hypothetical protein EVAR_64001_1 [Eumeta japonica]|uniref:Uncharacterized protein n=1 Tax=Eumeta variegata TaxID=151549 RepID=A0A4C1Z324_EUMVA|nr:hypothetical protein EVAR_64001_1 [Eumeta japonica]